MGRFRGGASRHGAPKKPALTHFLCLPLVNASSKPQLEQALETFRQDLTGAGPRASATSVEAGNDGSNFLPIIDTKALRPTGALHLTLGVMSLKEEQLIKAANCLQNLDLASILSEASPDANQAGAREDLRISLRGLESMHDVRKTSILYAAPTDATNRLYPLCLAVQKFFEAEGFLLEDDRKLKLHATIINTIYAKARRKPNEKSVIVPSTGQSISSHSEVTSDDDPRGHGPNANAPLKFDARSIVEKYKGYIWADSIVLDRISICEMGAKKITDSSGEVVDACYTEVASIKLSA